MRTPFAGTGFAGVYKSEKPAPGGLPPAAGAAARRLSCSVRFRPIRLSCVRFRPTFFPKTRESAGRKRSQLPPVGRKRSQHVAFPRISSVPSRRHRHARDSVRAIPFHLVHSSCRIACKAINPSKLWVRLRAPLHWHSFFNLVVKNGLWSRCEQGHSMKKNKGKAPFPMRRVMRAQGGSAWIHVS